MVEVVRRAVESRLPWFDVPGWRHERERQAAIVAHAQVTEQRGREVIAEYKRVARLRR